MGLSWVSDGCLTREHLGPSQPSSFHACLLPLCLHASCHLKAARLLTIRPGSTNVAPSVSNSVRVGDSVQVNVWVKGEVRVSVRVKDRVRVRGVNSNEPTHSALTHNLNPCTITTHRCINTQPATNDWVLND